MIRGFHKHFPIMRKVHQASRVEKEKDRSDGTVGKTRKSDRPEPTRLEMLARVEDVGELA